MLVPDGSCEMPTSGCHFAPAKRESGASLRLHLPRSSLKTETQHDQFGVRRFSPHSSVVNRRREEFCSHCACGHAASLAAMCAVVSAKPRAALGHSPGLCPWVAHSFLRSRSPTIEKPLWGCKKCFHASKPAWAGGGGGINPLEKNLKEHRKEGNISLKI